MIYNKVLSILISCFCVTTVCGVDNSTPITIREGMSWGEWFFVFNKNKDLITHEDQISLWFEKHSNEFKNVILKEMTKSVSEKNSMLHFLPKASRALLQGVCDRINQRNIKDYKDLKKIEKNLLNFIWNIWVFSHKDAESENISETLVTPLIEMGCLSIKHTHDLGDPYSEANNSKYSQRCEKYLIKHRLEGLIQKNYNLDYDGICNLIIGKYKHKYEKLSKSPIKNIDKYENKEFSESLIENIINMIGEMNGAVEQGEKQRNAKKNTLEESPEQVPETHVHKKREAKAAEKGCGAEEEGPQSSRSVRQKTSGDNGQG